MRVLVLPSTFNCRNMGDVAMLQACLANLRTVLPDAVVTVPTDLPDELRRHCPQAHPASADELRIWYHEDIFLGRFAAWVPPAGRKALSAAKKRLRTSLPVVQRGLASLRFPSRNTGDDDVTPFDEALRSASLIVVSGAGGLNDVCREWALATLAIVEEALDRRVPAAMLSQGIGPLRDPSILEKLRSVVPRLEMLTLREGLCGPRILEAFGVPEDTAMVTGDDAVTLAFDERPSVLGQALGLNLRLSPSSGLDEGILDQLAPVMRELPAGVPLLPVPIARDHDHSDSRSLEALGRRCGIPLAGSRDLDTPLKVIRQAGRCRLVVTGAYHAAVFALAQGIPAVCIAGSEYFRTKFDGLARSFPSGCEVLSVPDPEIGPKLLDAIRRAWQQAPQGRQRLLELARTQAQQSHRAYASLGRTLTFQESGR